MFSAFRCFVAASCPTEFTVVSKSVYFPKPETSDHITDTDRTLVNVLFTAVHEVRQLNRLLNKRCFWRWRLMSNSSGADACMHARWFDATLHADSDSSICPSRSFSRFLFLKVTFDFVSDSRMFGNWWAGCIFRRRFFFPWRTRAPL